MTRVDRLRERLQEPLLVTNPVNVHYLTGFVSSNATLLVEEDRVRLYTDFRYSTAARLLAGPKRPTNLAAALREAGVTAWPKALAEAEQALRHLGSRRCRQLPTWLEATDRSLKAEASRGLRARLALERFFCKMAGPATGGPNRPSPQSPRGS